MTGEDILISLDNAWKALARQYRNDPDEGVRHGLNLLAKIIGIVQAEAKEGRNAKNSTTDANQQITIDEWLDMLGQGGKDKKNESVSGGG